MKTKNSQKIADAFCKIICKWLTPEQLAEVNRLNATLDYAGCCATHDYYDSNVAMIEAFKEVIGRECLMPCGEHPEKELQADCDLMNKAWDIAKAQKFLAK